MSRDINLDGGEVSVLKAIGLGGGEVSGETLLSRCSDLDPAQLRDTLHGLLSQGYVEADSRSFHSDEEFAKTQFHVNSGYSRELRDSLDPTGEKKGKSRRVRRQ